MLFAANYDSVFPFDFSASPTNDYYSNNFMNSQNKNVVIENWNCLCKDKTLIETKGYDPSGSVEKLKVGKIYNTLYLNNFSSETSETNLDPSPQNVPLPEQTEEEINSLV
jgi:hypothetical protein